jgi:hypothetical protein
MLQTRFLARIKKFGIKRLFLSYDTYGAILTFILISYLTQMSVDYSLSAEPLLDVFISVSAIFFSIILAGLAIISSFTDKDFILAWIKIGEFDNVVTLFQYNLYIPLLILGISLFLRFVYYNSILMILLISLFVYMIISLIDLVKFIANYAIQRGNFIQIQSENSDHRE